MTEIVYDAANYTLEMKGHAGKKTAGENIYCAAASILAYTLAQNLKMAHCSGMLARKPAMFFGDGTAEISCVPEKAYSDYIRNVFHNICTGFVLLAKNYPDIFNFSAFEG